jgi:hypothetical protein
MDEHRVAAALRALADAIEAPSPDAGDASAPTAKHQHGNRRRRRSCVAAPPEEVTELDVARAKQAAIKAGILIR